MSAATLPHDPKWTRTNTLFSASYSNADFALIGVPAHESSISPTSAHLTPAAVREALVRYSTFSSSAAIDLAGNSFTDLGDVQSPDGEDGHARVKDAVGGLLKSHKLCCSTRWR